MEMTNLMKQIINSSIKKLQKFGACAVLVELVAAYGPTDVKWGSELYAGGAVENVAAFRRDWTG